MQDNNIPGQKRALYIGLYYTTFYVVNFPPSFYRKIFFQLFDVTGYLSHDICNSLCTDLPLPSEKIEGASVHRLKHSHYIDHNQYHIHSPRIQTESLSKRFFKGFSLQLCKFGADTKVILLTSVCLFILCAAMAGTNQIYATIICDLLVPILKTERPGCPRYKAG